MTSPAKTLEVLSKSAFRMILRDSRDEDDTESSHSFSDILSSVDDIDMSRINFYRELPGYCPGKSYWASQPI
jgi:hypothetical protein